MVNNGNEDLLAYDDEPVMAKSDGKLKLRWLNNGNLLAHPHDKRNIDRNDFWILPEYKEFENLDMKDVYCFMTTTIKKVLVLGEEIEYKLFTLWIISTWKVENWYYVGFPIFTGGHDCGKSTALQIIAQCGYRMFNSVNPSYAVMPRITHYHNGGLLIDEAHNTLKIGSDKLAFIKDSYKKGSIYPVCDPNNETRIVARRNFGFKAIAGERSFDPALVTRGILFYMSKSKPELPFQYALKDFADIRSKLLQYRLHKNEIPDLGPKYVLTGRVREVFESIIRTGIHIGIDVDDIVEYAQRQEKAELERRKRTPEYIIIKKIVDTGWFNEAAREIGHIESQIDIKTLFETLYDEEEMTEEEIKNTYKKLGWTLKRMGLSTERHSRSRYINFEDTNNNKMIKALIKTYGL